MKRFFKVVAFFVPLLFISFYSYSQQDDLGQWTNVSVTKKLTRQFSVYLEEEIRLYQNISRLNMFFSNIGAGYKINKTFKIAFTYRFIEKYEPDNSFSTRHRMYFDLGIKQKYKFIDFAYRARLQGQMRDIHSSDLGTLPETYWRNKFSFNFDLNQKYTPYLAAEWAYQFRDPQTPYADNGWVGVRYYIGCNYEINKIHSFDLYYLIQQEFNINNAALDYIIGVAYSVSL